MSNAVPINGFHTVGMIKDTAAVSLPAAALTDAVNVRFKNGSVEKVSGSLEVVANSDLSPLLNDGEVTYLAVWKNPNVVSTDNVYYVIVVTTATTDSLYLVDAAAKSYTSLNYETAIGGDWQHTEFQGGYGLVLNNGLSRPVYLLDSTGNTDASNIEAYELPGWDSYYTNITKVDDTYDSDIHIPDFDVGEIVDFTKFELIVDVINGTTGVRKFRQTLLTEGTQQQVTLSSDTTTNSHLVSIALAPGGVGENAFTEFLENGDQVIMSIRSYDITQITAGVIKSWGAKLVAGNLKEIDAPRVISVDTVAKQLTFTKDHSFVAGDKILLTQPSLGIFTVAAVPASDTIEVSETLSAGANYAVVRYTVISAVKGIRDLPGVVRISDAAAPGSIPNNWNPYSQGVSTAEEFQLASTGEVQDMAEMQGQLFVYTNSSIHQITETGNTVTPYIATDISYSYGALCEGAVLEFNGVHIVAGSNDIYQFSGHPASIQSLATGRVKDYLYNRIDYNSIDIELLFNQQENEIWVCYKTLDSVATERYTDILVWNYELNVWSEFTSHKFNTVCMGPALGWNGTSLQATVNTAVNRPIMSGGSTVFGADYKGKFTDSTSGNYESLISRLEAPITPEFDVEYLTSTALWANKYLQGDTNVDLELSVRGTDVLDEPFGTPITQYTPGPTGVTYTIGEDYKVDTRVNGRFISYLISDRGDQPGGWALSGLQFIINKGGRR